MTEPGTPHSRPGALDEAAQQQLIQQIGRVILRNLPPRWQEADIEYRAVGSHSELAAQLIAPNGTALPLAVPAEVERLFAQLRDGMYQSERGTWVSALYQLQQGGGYSVDFNGDYQPTWRTTPPAGAFHEELARYPRAGASIPSWMTEMGGPAPHR